MGVYLDVDQSQVGPLFYQAPAREPLRQRPTERLGCRDSGRARVQPRRSGNESLSAK